ncbi:uncharacterized protein [Chironomus tepperi]|uniref:uncharacterized protein n=1 Tax=Chironomus tepperi TaxID=113505 RepID=UPI00391F887E
MSFLIKFLTFITIILTITSAKKNDESFVEGVRYRGVKCKIDNQTLELKYCYVKAYSRKISLFSLGVKFINPVEKPIYVQIISNYQFGSGYREVVNSGRQEWCSVVEETSTNPFMKAVVEVVKDNPVARELFRQCPYSGDLEINNFSTTSLKMYDALPAGLYRFDVNVFKDEKMIFTMKINEEVKKDSN